MGSIIVNTKERVLCQGVSVFTGCQRCCKDITAKQTFMAGIAEAPDSKVSRLSNTKGSIKLWQRKILIGLI